MTTNDFQNAMVIAELIKFHPKFNHDLLRELGYMIEGYYQKFPDESDEREEAYHEAVSRARGVMQLHIMTICAVPYMTEEKAFNVADLICDDLR